MPFPTTAKMPGLGDPKHLGAHISLTVVLRTWGSASPFIRMCTSSRRAALNANAARYGGDPRRIVVMGCRPLQHNPRRRLLPPHPPVAAAKVIDLSGLSTLAAPDRETSAPTLACFPDGMTGARATELITWPSRRRPQARSATSAFSCASILPACS